MIAQANEKDGNNASRSTVKYQYKPRQSFMLNNIETEIFATSFTNLRCIWFM